MAALSHISVERVLRIVCVIALLCLGLAHNSPAIAVSSLTADEIAALTLPDGTLPELCLQSEDGKGKANAMSPDCQACRISAAVILSAPGDETGMRMPLTASVTLPQPPEAHHHQLFPPDSHPRAPPVAV